ncbi:MAG: FtsX-like permease family protein [Cytophagaceae bacterium]|nr:FtsX-like permease family protein [Cytophagaceae bacterium]
MYSTNFRIAKTHLLAKKKQTIVAILGVTFGIAMYVLMASVLTGVNKLVDNLAFQATAHIRLYKEADINRESVLETVYRGSNTLVKVHHQKPIREKLYLRNASEILDDLRRMPQVTGVSAQVSSPVFYNFGSVQFNGTLLGVNIFDEDRLFDLKGQLKSGRLENLLANPNSLLMGIGLARKMNVLEGDNVTVVTPRGVVFVLKVVGIYKSGIGALDNVRSYTNIGTVQKLLQTDPTYITDINIKVRDVYSAAGLAPQWAKRYGVKAEDWATANSTMVASNKIRDIMTYIVSVTLLVVAGFGIYNIMSMTVNDKMKDIAILKATGFSGRDIIQIFLTEAVIIGILGALLGVVLGFVFSWMVSKAPFDGGDFISIDHFPVNFNPVFYLIGVVFGVVTTLLAGYFPARRAADIDPVAILRG